MRTSNPINSENAYLSEADAQRSTGVFVSETMTVDGAVNKTYILLAVLIAAAAYSWSAPNMLMIYGGLAVGFICALVMAFKRSWAPYLAPVYAIGEGLFIGGISVVINSAFSKGELWGGIVFQAVTLTIAVLFMMLTAYKAGWIQVTQKLRTGIMIATAAVGVVYLLSFLLSLAGIHMPYIHESGVIGIGFSLVVIGIAAFNLLLDFQLFYDGEQYGAPKYMEWYAAFGLLVTLVWLYLEILRLLMKLQRRN